MDTKAPTLLFIPISVAPKKAPCPYCGKRGRRTRIRQRNVRTIAYRRIAYLKITYGEYKARCSCCTTFHTRSEQVLPKAKYDNQVRQAVLDRILEDGMNVEATLRSLRRDFLLELSTGFVYDCLHDAVAQLHMSSHRQQVLENFSGTLCVDELHLGKQILLLATDPLADIPVAFALVKSNDQDHMQRFLNNLAQWGLQPEVVITDGSPLYPAVLAHLWPRAEHQLCVFHVMQDINAKILDALKRLRRSMARRGKGGRKRKRGRPTKRQPRDRSRQGPTHKEKAHFIFKHRYRIVQRQENMKDREKKDLQTMLEYHPELGVLRRFSDAVYKLLSEDQSETQAWSRWQTLQDQAEYGAIPELKQVLEKVLEAEKFNKMVAFLRRPVGKRLRTNNHVERCNRKLRYWEKVRYKWRRRRTLVRFLVLALDRWWKRAWSQREKQESRASKPANSATHPKRLVA